MIAALTDHLWQSTVFSIVAALLAAALRRNGAHVRYWVWFAASVKFLVPFALVMLLGARLALVPTVPRAAAPEAPALAVAVDRVAQPFSAIFSESAAEPRRTPSLAAVGLAALWVSGLAVVAGIRIKGWRAVRAAVRASRPVEMPGAVGALAARSSPGVLEPGVIGVWRPVLLVPAGITDRLTPAQLHAVVAHEVCHAARRDNLTAAIHMIVEALFWFHPLVWWIGARLVEERERACDEAVLRLGLEPRDYAEGILNVCRLYVESPLACVPGVCGADITRRIEAIMINRIGSRLNLRRKAALFIAAVAAFFVPLAAGVVTAPLRAQASPEPGPRFEVASIRPCESLPVVPGGRGGGGGPVFSPGRFFFNCGTLEQLILAAYVTNGEPLLNDATMIAPARRSYDPAAFPERIRGGPSWVRSEKFTIEAKAGISTGRTGREAVPERKILMGPMLRALLEERFQLRLRRDVQDNVPMYALTVAKGGLKIAPMGPDDCTPLELNISMPPPIGLEEEIARVSRGGKPFCGHGIMGGRNGPAEALVLNGQTMDGVASALSRLLDRHVLNRTNVDGKFLIYLEYAPDEHTPAIATAGADAPDYAGPNIFAALEKLGLRIEPAKGPKGFIVIDRAERPSIDGR